MCDTITLIRVVSRIQRLALNQSPSRGNKGWCRELLLFLSFVWHQGILLLTDQRFFHVVDSISLSEKQYIFNIKSHPWITDMGYLLTFITYVTSSVLGLLALGFYLKYFRAPIHSLDEPPLIPYTWPFFGHLYEFLKDQIAFLAKAK